MNRFRSCKRWWQHFGFFLSWLKAWIGKFKQQRCKKNNQLLLLLFWVVFKTHKNFHIFSLASCPERKVLNLTRPDVYCAASSSMHGMPCQVSEMFALWGSRNSSENCRMLGMTHGPQFGIQGPVALMQQLPFTSKNQFPSRKSKWNRYNNGKLENNLKWEKNLIPNSVMLHF